MADENSNSPGESLDRDWLLITATREALSIGRRETVTYSEATSALVELAPSLVSGEVLAGRESELARYYREFAATRTEHEQQEVSPRDLALADLAALDQLIKRSSEVHRPAMVRRQIALRQVVQILSETTWTEAQAINFDAGIPAEIEDRVLPVSGRGRGYLEYRAHGSRMMRVRVLHPDPGEWKTGVDLIYERYWYDEDQLFVRIAALQYKMWDGRTLYLDERSSKQLDRMHETLCAQSFCECDNDGIRNYRLPHCCAFLRPTDRKQTTSGNRVTRGWHIPSCVALDSLRKTSSGKSIVVAQSVRDTALTQDTFQELFNRNMLGSAYFPVDKLEEVYRVTSVLQANDLPVFHVQEYSPKHLGPDN